MGDFKVTRRSIAARSMHQNLQDRNAQFKTRGADAWLQVALERDDVQVVTDFVVNPDDAEADPVLRYWR
jgi:hypothetical protein